MKKAPVQKRTLPTRADISKHFSTVSTKVVSVVDRRPLISFFAILGVVVLLILAGHFLNRPKIETTEKPKVVKSVQAYRIGTAPSIVVGAQVRKSGVIQIVALTTGVIDKINVQEGAEVNPGETLISMSSNYKGDNALALQRQVAATQYQGALATYPKQKETIQRQKELAEKTEENSEEMRKILKESISETQTLLSANEEGLRLLEEQIKELEQNPVQGTDVRNLKQQRAQFIAAINQTRQALRTNEYNAGADNAPAEIAELNKEITKRQLDVQLKQLQISVEVSRLQVAVAQVNESLMFPTAPFSGTIQRVFVKEKQVVTPGTPLFIIAQVTEDDPITAVAYVSADVAKRVSRMQPSTLRIGDTIKYQTIPTFVSTEAVQGTLYAVYFPIPEQYSSHLVSEGFITVEIPIGFADTTTIATYIPLDAIYQTRENAYIFVMENGQAVSRTIQIGQVYGRYVEVTSGLHQGDTVILNRNILDGDFIQPL